MARDVALSGFSTMSFSFALLFGNTEEMMQNRDLMCTTKVQLKKKIFLCIILS